MGLVCCLSARDKPESQEGRPVCNGKDPVFIKIQWYLQVQEGKMTRPKPPKAGRVRVVQWSMYWNQMTLLSFNI
jgi:hypothetical protein